MNIYNSHCIGFIDSGWGGMTIHDTAVSMLPNLSTVYIADHLYMPYGTKSDAIIHDRVIGMMKFLIAKGVELIVIACNTASVAGIQQYRAVFPNVPIIAVVPVVKTAAEKTTSHSFALFATEKTSESPYVQALIDRFAPHARVTKIGSRTLASLIEQGDKESESIRREVARMVSSMHEDDDVIVLGCTHYPFVKQLIEKEAGSHRCVIDSSGAVSRQIGRMLAELPENSSLEGMTHTIYTTGDPTVHGPILSRLTGQSRIVEQAIIA